MLSKKKKKKTNSLDVAIFPENLRQTGEFVSLLCFLVSLKLLKGRTFLCHFTDAALLLHPFHSLLLSGLHTHVNFTTDSSEHGQAIPGSGHCCNAATNRTMHSLASGVSSVQDIRAKEWLYEPIYSLFVFGFFNQKQLYP